MQSEQSASVRKKILFLLPRFPFPLIKGDQLRAYHQMRVLSRYHDVYLFAVTDREVSESEKEQLHFVAGIELFHLSKIGIAARLFRTLWNDRPFQAAYFYSEEAKEALADFWGRIKPDAAFCQLVRMAAYGKDVRSVPIVLDFQDAFSAGLERRIKEAKLGMRKLLEMEFHRMQSYEQEVFDLFRLKTIISEQDRDLIPHPRKKEIHILKNGVDTEYFRPEDKVEKKIDLLFTGNMSYPPNINCVHFVAKEVLPLLLPEYPHLRFTIAGANPVKSVLDLASKNIEVTGFVEDMRDYYHAAKVFVAPMQIGIGLQNKLLEAMSSELPCITSPLAHNALGGEPEKELYVCESAPEIAARIKLLLQNETLRNEVGKQARHFVHRQYSWEAENEKLMRLFNG